MTTTQAGLIEALEAIRAEAKAATSSDGKERDPYAIDRIARMANSAIARTTQSSRECTCPPDERPEICPKRYALSECVATQSSEAGAAAAYLYRNEDGLAPVAEIVSLVRWTADNRVDWTETPLYAHPPAQPTPAPSSVTDPLQLAKALATALEQSDESALVETPQEPVSPTTVDGHFDLGGVARQFLDGVRLLTPAPSSVEGLRDEDIERVARAIVQAEAGDHGPSGVWMRNAKWEDFTTQQQDDFRRVAKAAITALTQRPSEEQP